MLVWAVRVCCCGFHTPSWGRVVNSENEAVMVFGSDESIEVLE